MKREFWLERWQQNQIGFHQADVNKALQKFSGELGLSQGETVFVPLCGKSHDLAWLQQQGYRVLGVELSEIAAKTFYEEHELNPEISTRDGFQSFRANNIEILCGDFFEMTKAMLSGAHGVFDRASMIAMPPDMRVDYARKMTELLDSGARILLVTMEYPDGAMQGPPFTVPEQNVRDLYEKEFNITVLEHNDILQNQPQFKERGLTALAERIYLLQKK